MRATPPRTSPVTANPLPGRGTNAPDAAIRLPRDAMSKRPLNSKRTLPSPNRSSSSESVNTTKPRAYRFDAGRRAKRANPVLGIAQVVVFEHPWEVVLQRTGDDDAVGRPRTTRLVTSGLLVPTAVVDHTATACTARSDSVRHGRSDPKHPPVGLRDPLDAARWREPGARARRTATVRAPIGLHRVDHRHHGDRLRCPRRPYRAMGFSDDSSVRSWRRDPRLRRNGIDALRAGGVRPDDRQRRAPGAVPPDAR